jgi:hypothetical protein
MRTTQSYTTVLRRHNSSHKFLAEASLLVFPRKFGNIILRPSSYSCITGRYLVDHPFYARDSMYSH